MSEFDPLAMAKKSPTFCVMPWIHQYVDTQGSIKPCCMYGFDTELGTLKENTLKEIWNSDKTKQMRLNFLNGISDPDCYRCYNRGPSFRTGQNDFYLPQEKMQEVLNSTKPDGTVEEHKMFYIDIRFNNLCNFTCRTCSPHFSTSWIPDHIKLNDIAPDAPLVGILPNFHFPGKTEEQGLNEILPHLKYADHIYFAGGEPLMQKEHYQVLDKLIEEKNFDIDIRYNTNFSKLVNRKVDIIDYWKQFTKLNIHASIDGSHEKAEYWRKGTVWSNIVANKKRLQEECPNAKFAITYTLSWVNVFDALDLHREWVELGYIKPDEFLINCLDGPDHYSLKNIPDWKKDKIELAINQHLDWVKTLSESCDMFEYMLTDSIKFMRESDPALVQPSMLNFILKNTKLDKIRSEHFFDIYPEHDDMKEYFQTI